MIDSKAMPGADHFEPGLMGKGTVFVELNATKPAPSLDRSCGEGQDEDPIFQLLRALTFRRDLLVQGSSKEILGLGVMIHENAWDGPVHWPGLANFGVE